jgi:hypothetical protein
MAESTMNESMMNSERPGPNLKFGRYLATIAERDIDLLLMEEFHVCDDFVAWFCSEIGLDAVTPSGAWHSVSDTDGETDLLLEVVKDLRRIGILIENKIGAPEQNLQAERYHLRGIRSREEGKLDDYVTVMCAPQSYLSALNPESPYQHRFPYERIAEWFRRRSGRRATWRYGIMLEAIDQGRRGYTMTVNPIATAFHRAYWEHLCRQHPRLQMVRPDKRGSNSTWIIMRGLDFPKGVQIHHKFGPQLIELGFNNRRIEEILAIKAKTADWPADIEVVQKGKTASLAIHVPSIDMKLGVEAQITAIEEALRAAYRLIPYASLFQSIAPDTDGQSSP